MFQPAATFRNPLYREEPQTSNRYEDEQRSRQANPSQARSALQANPSAQIRQTQLQNPFHSSEEAVYSPKARLAINIFNLTVRRR